MTETLKYQCGCGKAYTSYPAYSTHKRLKHHNQSIIGTNLPKLYIPKRGRPSFSVPQQHHSQNHYSAMTTIEVALLKLQEKYPTVLNDPETDGNLDILNLYEDCDKLVSCPTGESLTKSIKNFNSIIINHSIDSVSIHVSRFLVNLTQFLLQNLSSSTVELEWLQDKIKKIDVLLFNKYFIQKGQKQRVAQMAKAAGKPMRFLLDLTVALSEYLCKIGISESVLTLKA